MARLEPASAHQDTTWLRTQHKSAFFGDVGVWISNGTTHSSVVLRVGMPLRLIPRVLLDNWGVPTLPFCLDVKLHLSLFCATFVHISF